MISLVSYYICVYGRGSFESLTIFFNKNAGDQCPLIDWFLCLSPNYISGTMYNNHFADSLVRVDWYMSILPLNDIDYHYCEVVSKHGNGPYTKAVCYVIRGCLCYVTDTHARWMLEKYYQPHSFRCINNIFQLTRSNFVHMCVWMLDTHAHAHIHSQYVSRTNGLLSGKESCTHRV